MPAVYGSDPMVSNRRLAKPARPPYLPTMITRADIIWLGLSSGVAGGLVGGLLLGIGLGIVVQGANIGWLLIMPAAPLSGLNGWILARKLAKQIK
jgi:predicted lipid-binding transport protein (Tim44 family)